MISFCMQLFLRRKLRNYYISQVVSAYQFTLKSINNVSNWTNTPFLFRVMSTTCDRDCCSSTWKSVRTPGTSSHSEMCNPWLGSWMEVQRLNVTREREMKWRLNGFAKTGRNESYLRYNSMHRESACQSNTSKLKNRIMGSHHARSYWTDYQQHWRVRQYLDRSVSMELLMEPNFLLDFRRTTRHRL